MLVCGILQGLNESLLKKRKSKEIQENANESDTVVFNDFNVLDPELIEIVKLKQLLK